MFLGYFKNFLWVNWRTFRCWPSNSLNNVVVVLKREVTQSFLFANHLKFLKGKVNTMTLKILWKFAHSYFWFECFWDARFSLLDWTDTESDLYGGKDFKLPNHIVPIGDFSKSSFSWLSFTFVCWMCPKFLSKHFLVTIETSYSRNPQL